ncbi:MAG TPA: sigma-54 dependent transcriptional regulator [Candidatus Krumholzibacteria bacterium]|nr:sigma-54 dependent transcriptional regulator [Candidatus Krumholzibacteria bacterium]HPD71530.1 sigma-54 dependent transcriptional regulator [Candidatus Krumholzibacteria bacterium]HRY41537.1 sigma-54 dependent transcriptional regulator [Candidatus Krumholzibacteria bacterium]
MQPHVLIIDDQEAIRLFLAATLEARGYRVSTAGTGAAGLDQAAREAPDLVLLDLRLPDLSGLQVLARLKEAAPQTCVVILTSYGRTDAAVEAMKLQAFDFVTKPVNLDHLLAVIHRGLEAGESSRRRAQARTADDLFASLPGVVPGRSAVMQPVYETVRRVAAGGRSTVLILGESGVGKDILAQVIHRNSPRRDYPFLEVNCASLPEQLLESELFGHERGAFTDAAQQKLGLLELAHSGTLFLDEIGEMSLPIQVKLLRVLEKMAFRRVGGLEDIQVDVRLIAATNRDLAGLVAQGVFRSDLYYRLKVVELTVPPLRQRPEDLPDLARYFLRVYNEEFGKQFRDISPAALEVLAAQPWPGNVRELRNTIERAVLLGDGTELGVGELQIDAPPGDAGGDAELVRVLETALTSPLPAGGIVLDDLVERFEIAMIRKAMAAAADNQSLASRLLHLGRDRLRYRLKNYEL